MAKTKTSKAPELRVWIELEKPADTEQAKRICDLANNMLKRLCNEFGREEHFFWSDHERRYCYGGNMGYRVLSDNGEWFNLEYLGRPLEAGEVSP